MILRSLMQGPTSFVWGIVRGVGLGGGLGDGMGGRSWGGGGCVLFHFGFPITVDPLNAISFPAVGQWWRTPLVDVDLNRASQRHQVFYSLTKHNWLTPEDADLGKANIPLCFRSFIPLLRRFICKLSLILMIDHIPKESIEL